ncbi:potassium transporter 10-like isoform X2 [Andrographis paniculata]|uniref:potassium transporter 10-like isoform X2 n=1 Tax=Andrographis paniculata TaxID=175694 RepID=UPI0021E94348|nr:potassium transporter 10-like isoform X2 [Andrographis paniculata]
MKFKNKKETWKHTLILSFQSLGVIYGRLSTAPLYVMESIRPGDIRSPDEIHELFSFVFWTLTIIPLVKYSFIVLRADDDGEGGPFALYSLLCRHASVGLIPCDKSSDKILHHEEHSPSKKTLESKARRTLEKHKSCHYLLFFLALFGACMILSDAVLTPAISVLSATSGLGRSLAKISAKFITSDHAKVHVAKTLKKYVPTPAACAILVCLFTFQHHGTKRIGIVLAPIVITWLFFIGGFGLYNIFHYDMHILNAISPVYMLKFIKKISLRHWKLLSSIILCIAGTESMFADLGHFSKKSIKITFICFIYPILLVTYAGQAAFIFNNFRVEDAFHLSESIPNKSLQHIFAVLSLFASAVGSQATITAGFSIINQCQALNCFPRVKIVHTSEQILGQVYVPDVNWLFMILSLAFTIGLQDVSQLGKATALAVTCAMLVTTCLMSLVIALYWERSLFASISFLLFFGSIEAMYLTTSLVNFLHGAWCLIILLLLFMMIMAAWHYGTLKKYQFDIENKVSIDWLTDYSPGLGVARVPGIGFIYSDIEMGIPAFFSHFITNLPAFHQVLIFVSFKSSPVPYVADNRRYLIGRVGPREYKIYRCIVRYGYRDSVRDTDDFEDQIISSIGEYITREEYDCEALSSPEGKMIVLGGLREDGNALIPVDDTISTTSYSPKSGASESKKHLPDVPSGSLENPNTGGSRKRVRFMLPAKSPRMLASVRQELQEMIDARESGTAYFLGQSHLLARKGSNFFKKLLIMMYVFLDKNGREPPVALNIPNAALLEVGTVYTI